MVDSVEQQIERTKQCLVTFKQELFDLNDFRFNDQKFQELPELIKAILEIHAGHIAHAIDYMDRHLAKLQGEDDGKSG